MTENIGEIVYTVSSDTSALLQSQRTVDTSTSSMQRSFDKTDRSVNTLNTSLKALSTAITAALTIGALTSLAKMVNGYQEMSERVRGAVNSANEFAYAQQRIIESSNKTFRSVSETSETFIRTSASLRDMGYSLSEAMDITESLSLAFVRNATSSQKADSSIQALTKSVQSGRVSSDSWAALLSAVPTIVENIAKASGKTSQEIKKLGVEGKLAIQDLTEGIRLAREENDQFAAGMTTTLNDAMGRLSTSVTAMAVSFENNTHLVAGFTQAILSISDYLLKFSTDGEKVSEVLDTLGTTLGILASFFAGKFASSVGLATVNVIANMKANLAAARSAITLANGMKALNAAFSVAGGLVGVLTTAVSILAFFKIKSDTARDAARDFADSIVGATDRIKEMNAVQAKGAAAKLTLAIQEQQKAYNDASNDVTRYKNLLAGQERQLSTLTAGTAAYEMAQKSVANAANNLAQAEAKEYEAGKKLEGQKETLNMLNEQAAPSAYKAADGVRDYTNAAGQSTEAGKKLINSLQNQLALFNEIPGAARNAARAVQAAAEAGATEEEQKLIADLTKQIFAKEEAERASAKATKSSISESNHAADALASQAAQLARLNTGYAEGSVELAKYDAVLALGAKATAEQRAEAEKQAAAIHTVTTAIKANEEAEKNRIKIAEDFASLQQSLSPVLAVDTQYQQQMAMLDEYVTLYPQKIQEAEAARAAIEDQYHQQRLSAMWEEWAQMSEINAMTASVVDNLQGGATNAITGLINGTQSLAESFANIGTTILNSVVGSVVQMGIEWVKSYLMQETAAASAQATAAAGLAASTAAGLAQAAALSAAYAPAAMAASIATQGAAAVTGQAAYTAAMATSRIAALEKGGPASAGQLYRVGEKGPEIFSSGGKNYMIPGQSGSVTPNREIAGTGGGGVVQTNSFTINTTGGIDNETMAKLTKMMKQVSLNTIKNEQRPHGSLQKSR